MNEINELDAKHDYYADELEKIKAMLQWMTDDHSDYFEIYTVIL